MRPILKQRADDDERGGFRRQRPRAAWPTQTGAFYTFGEAFMLMKYASKDGREIEWLWNSRDGVTPFAIAPTDGPTALEHFLQHVDWQDDVRVPAFVPPIGMRIFVNLSWRRANEDAWARVQRDWDHPDYPMRDAPFADGGKATAAEHLAKEIFGDGLQPTVVTVTADMRAQFIERVRSAENYRRG